MGVLKKLLLAFVAVAAAMMVTFVPASTTDKPSTKLTFTLDFTPLGRHAPWYAALGKGYFRDEGLDVTIIPAQGSAHALHAIDSGGAQLGFIGVAGLVLARARGVRMKIVAINYQKAPYAIFSLANGANVTRIKQLEGLTLGSGASSFTPSIIMGAMARNGLDPKKIKFVNTPPQKRANMLLTGNIPAIEFFAMARPGLQQQAREAGTELKTLLLGDTGLELYSNGIAAREDFLANHPDVVRKFVRAALKGWRFALGNPEKAAELQRRYIKNLDPNMIVAELDVVRDLAVTPDTRANGLGWYDPAKMQASLDFVIKHIGVPESPPKAGDLYAEGFLPQTPIKP